MGFRYRFVPLDDGNAQIFFLDADLPLVKRWTTLNESVPFFKDIEMLTDEEIEIENSKR